MIEDSVDNTLNGVYRVYHIRLSEDMVITYSYRHTLPYNIHIGIFKNDTPVYYNYNDVNVDTRDILNSVIDVILGRIVRIPNSIPIYSMKKSLTDFELNIFKESVKNLKNAVDSIIELESTTYDCDAILENNEYVCGIDDKEKESPIKKEKFNAIYRLKKWILLGGKK